VTCRDIVKPAYPIFLVGGGPHLLNDSTSMSLQSFQSFPYCRTVGSRRPE